MGSENSYEPRRTYQPVLSDPNPPPSGTPPSTAREDHLVPGRTTAVLGRTRAAARDAKREFHPSLGPGRSLVHDRVQPIVAEVVEISRDLHTRAEHRRDWDLPPGLGWTILGKLLMGESDAMRWRFGIANNLEFVQVIVQPSHRVLNRHVQIPKGVALRDENSAPDERLRAGKDDEEL